MENGPAVIQYDEDGEIKMEEYWQDGPSRKSPKKTDKFVLNSIW